MTIDDWIERAENIAAFEYKDEETPHRQLADWLKDYKRLLECDNYIKIPDTGIEDLSDGYHTFRQLYHQRAILFATIVNQNKEYSWKSWKHEDGQYCFDSNGDWFIVGIDTPEGSYTYHYEKQYWDKFKCSEIPCGKHWDGHTEDDVTRLLSLSPKGMSEVIEKIKAQEPCEDAINREKAIGVTQNAEILQECKDAISREWVKRFLYSYYECVNENTVKENYSGNTLMDYEVAEMIEDCIENAPPVCSTRPRGEWISSKCSICGKRAYYWNDVSECNFCSYCGADMRKKWKVQLIEAEIEKEHDRKHISSEVPETDIVFVDTAFNIIEKW